MTVLANPSIQRAEFVEHWTHDDFMRLAPEDKKAELIDGRIVIYPPVFDTHARLYGFLLCIVGGFVDKFHLGRVIGCRYAVCIAEDQTYEPDLMFVQRDRTHLMTQAKMLETPDLVIELVSSVNADYLRGSKRLNYEKAGLRELWLIDPYGPAGTQFFQRQGDRLIEVAPVDGIFHSAALAGLKLQVRWLWPDQNDQLPNPIDVLKELKVKI